MVPCILYIGQAYCYSPEYAFYILSQQIYYLIIFLDLLSPSSFIPPQNVVYFLMLSFLVHKIFTFYINGVLNCKCPAPGPKCWYVLRDFFLTPANTALKHMKQLYTSYVIFVVHFNIILSPTSVAYKVSLPLRFSNKSYIWFIPSPKSASYTAGAILLIFSS